MYHTINKIVIMELSFKQINVTSAMNFYKMTVMLYTMNNKVIESKFCSKTDLSFRKILNIFIAGLKIHDKTLITRDTIKIWHHYI